jgi:hypothetical protein
MAHKTKKTQNATHDNSYKPAEDISNLWRFGIIETYSPVFESYIRQNEQVTIKPGVSIKVLESELTAEYNTLVRLYVPDSMR